MSLFRKKPVVIEAIQWTGENADEVQTFLHNDHKQAAAGWVKGRYVEIGTLEGLMVASIGDWIIKGVKGEFYPCKPDIFEQTYETAERVKPTALVAPVAAQPPAIFCDEEHVAVPRGLIGAAISAIDKKREGTKLLTELRRYTTGDLSTPVAYQSQNIAETAKRVLIALRADDLGDLLRASDHGPLAAITRALTVQPQAPAAQGDAIAEDDDGMPVGFAGWYNRRFAMLEVDTSRTSYCEDAWRAALQSQDREDAERYRWLRDPCSGAEYVIFYSRGDYGKGLMSGSMLDEAIDHARRVEEDFNETA